jgi:hypothetical protein
MHGELHKAMRLSLTNGSGTYFSMSSFCVKKVSPAREKGRVHWRNNCTPTCRMSCRAYQGHSTFLQL